MSDQVADTARQRRATIRASHSPSDRELAYRLASHSASGPLYSFALRDDEPATDDPAPDESE